MEHQNNMDIKAIQHSAYDASQTEDMVVIGVFAEDPLSGIIAGYDELLGGGIAKRITDGDFSPKLGNTHTEFYTEYDDATHAVVKNVRIALVGLGKKGKFDRRAFDKAADAAISLFKGRKFASVLVRLIEEVGSAAGSEPDALREFITKLVDAQYSFNGFKSKAEPVDFPASVTVLVTDDTDATTAQDAVNTGIAIAHGIALTKDLGNTPANVCTPTWLADQAQQLAVADPSKVSVTVMIKDQIEQAGMNSFLAVARGSVQEPKLIVVRYNGHTDKNDTPIALVGKGITFDTGGISIKPASAMDEMQYDMLGAATVLGVIRACSERGVNKNIVGVIPACENMPGPDAMKPGDIIKSMAGKTIEVLNTDAEGRLILCDALTYTQRMEPKPELVIDIATLTGAICVALGSTHTGMFTNDEALADDLVKAGKRSGDTVWHMPVDDEYDDTLKSAFADIGNIGGRDGGSSSAACFLKRFVEEGTRWAHLDIAGTASTGGRTKSATGRPVAMLYDFIVSKTN